MATGEQAWVTLGRCDTPSRVPDMAWLNWYSWGGSNHKESETHARQGVRAPLATGRLVSQKSHGHRAGGRPGFDGVGRRWWRPTRIAPDHAAHVLPDGRRHGQASGRSKECELF